MRARLCEAVRESKLSKSCAGDDKCNEDNVDNVDNVDNGSDGDDRPNPRLAEVIQHLADARADLEVIVDVSSILADQQQHLYPFEPM